MALKRNSVVTDAPEGDGFERPTVRLDAYFNRDPNERLPEGDKRQADFLQEWERLWHSYAVELLNVEAYPSPRTIAITSAIRGEGRTTSATALALALSQEAEEPVILVDGDLEHPHLAEIFRALSSPGLVDYLAGERRVEETIRPTAIPNLWLIPSTPLSQSGDVRTAMARLRRRLPSLASELRMRFGHVIIDLPPALEDANVAVAARQVDAVIHVVRAGLTPLPKLEESVEALGDAVLFGTVYFGDRSSLPQWLVSAFLD